LDRQFEIFIDRFVEELKEENAAVFAGAGLSVAAGYVDWKNLLLPIAQQLGLDVDKEHDLVSLAQYHCNERSGNRHELNQRLINEFCAGHAITENHRILARLPIRTFWTTNYDRLIEKALEDTGKIADVKYTVKQLALTRAKRDAVVYKMHGDVEHPDEAVLTKDDYERYHFDRQPFITAISGDMVSKTFLFLGFSFTDPNLDYILSRIRVMFTSSQREHYCIFKRRQRSASESESAYNYDVIKQELAIKDLKRFNVTALLVNDYSEITAILRIIEDRYRQKAVFISGSAHEYGSFPDPENFIQNLSQSLIRSGYQVVSGFGLGVGTYVIMGALQQVYEKEGKLLHDQLTLRPFPQGGADIQRQWEAYRKDMISYAGIAIFAFGNKLMPNGNVANADGMRKEFDIAKEKGLKLIPIGATSYVAQELWKEVHDNFNSYYPNATADFKAAFEMLNNTSAAPAKLLEVIGKILNMLRGR